VSRLAPEAIQIALMQRRCFADPQTGTPEQHHQRSKAVALGTVSDRAMIATISSTV
jgi:hypothetical protein